MSQKLTNEKARELLKELQYAKVQMGGQLSIRDEYFKQALEDKLRLEHLMSEPIGHVGTFVSTAELSKGELVARVYGTRKMLDEPVGTKFYAVRPEAPL